MEKITAPKGFKYYNGNTIASELYLPDGADKTVWKQITEAEAIEIEKNKMLEFENIKLLKNIEQELNILDESNPVI